MTELVKYKIPASFIVARVLPTGAELAYGFQHGWASRADVVAISEAKYRAGVPLTGPEEELLLLLPEDLDRVDELAAALEITDEPVERRARLWLFLALAWLLENRSMFGDPLGVIEMLYADFDYPDEISELVRFMPAASGQATGLEGIEARWSEYVERVGAEYRERTASMVQGPGKVRGCDD